MEAMNVLKKEMKLTRSGLCSINAGVGKQLGSFWANKIRGWHAVWCGVRHAHEMDVGSELRNLGVACKTAKLQWRARQETEISEQAKPPTQSCAPMSAGADLEAQSETPQQ